MLLSPTSFPSPCSASISSTEIVYCILNASQQASLWKPRKSQSCHFPGFVETYWAAHLLVPRSRRSAHIWAHAFDSQMTQSRGNVGVSWLVVRNNHWYKRFLFAGPAFNHQSEEWLKPWVHFYTEFHFVGGAAFCGRYFSFPFAFLVLPSSLTLTCVHPLYIWGESANSPCPLATLEHTQHLNTICLFKWVGIP